MLKQYNLLLDYTAAFYYYHRSLWGFCSTLYTQQTNHALSDLPYILLQKEPFTEILRVTSSLCGGPESHKPDIAEG